LPKRWLPHTKCNDSFSPKGTGNPTSGIDGIIKDATIGLGFSLDSNLLYGVAFSAKGLTESDLPNSTSYKVGKVIGDVASMIGGAAQTAVGVAGEVLGFAADGTIVLSPAGVAINVASAAVVANGANTMRRSANSLSNDLYSFSSEGAGDPKTYQTYTKTNPTTGDVYSGRTSGTGTPAENVAKRDGNHHMNDKGFGPAELDKTSSNKNAIRGREQQLIEANGGAKSEGGTSGNAINGIGPNNKKKDIYIKAAEEEFK
jgi:hypothetical protein